MTDHSKKLKSISNEQVQFIRSLRGKYKNCFSSTEDFSQQKQAEIDWEERSKRI